MARAVSLQAAAVSLVRRSRTSGAPCACFPSALEKPNSLSTGAAFTKSALWHICILIGVHLVGSHLRLHSQSGGKGSAGPCRQPMSSAILLCPEGLQQPSLSMLTESEKSMSFTKHTINRLSLCACLGEDERQHYAFIFVANGLQSCRLISFLAQVGTAGENIECCCTVREPSGTRLVVSPCTMRCQIRASAERDHSRGYSVHHLLSTSLFVTLGAVSAADLTFQSVCATGSEGLFCIVIESACLDVVQYPIRGSLGSNAPWVFEHV